MLNFRGRTVSGVEEEEEEEQVEFFKYIFHYFLILSLFASNQHKPSSSAELFYRTKTNRKNDNSSLINNIKQKSKENESQPTIFQ